MKHFLERLLDWLPDSDDWDWDNPRDEWKAFLRFLVLMGFFFPLHYMAGVFVRSELVAAAVALVAALSALSLVERWFHRRLDEDVSNAPSLQALSELSQYELALEADKAKRVGDKRRLDTVEAESRRRQ